MKTIRRAAARSRPAAIAREIEVGAVEDRRDLAVAQRRSRGGPSARAYSRRGKVGQRVDRALQDVRGSERVDLLGAAGAADVGVDHRPLDGLSRPALVPQQDRQLERRQVAGEGADRLRSRAIAAVHVERQTDDEPDDMLMLDERRSACEILGELGAADRFGRPGKMPAGIAHREADGLGADVEPGELAALGERVRESAGRGRDQRCQAASLRSASRRIAPQNRA